MTTNTSEGPGPRPRMSWSSVCARRLDRHGLEDPAPAAHLAELVGVICGAHAQVLSAAELSVALRVEGATSKDVRRALWEDRTLVKTFGPRGTIHLLPAAELPLWMAALDSLPHKQTQPPNVRMTDDQTQQVVAAIADALADAELTVDELTDAVVERAGPWAGEPVMEAFQGNWPRWRQATALAARRGALCFGPNRGRNITYTSPRRWVADYEPVDHDAGIAHVVRRYLHAYGSATSQQFAQWFAAPNPWAARAFERFAGDDEAEPTGRSNALRLLPYFDAYGIGCHPRAEVFPGRAADRALVKGQAGNVPLVLVSGVVCGVWHLKRSGRKAVVTVETFAALTKAQQRQLDEQVARVGTIIEAEPTPVLGEVPVGGHL